MDGWGWVGASEREREKEREISLPYDLAHFGRSDSTAKI